MPRSFQIKPFETKDAHGNVTACYDVLQIDPQGQVKMVCVGRRSDDGFDLMITFQDGTSDWSIPVPAGQARALDTTGEVARVSLSRVRHCRTPTKLLSSRSVYAKETQGWVS
jgi:hypothetical protein